jgi:hypothetical protein
MAKSRLQEAIETNRYDRKAEQVADTNGSGPTKIIIPYKPRDIFLPYHNAPHRFALTVAHRRAGKTVARVNKLVRAAATCTKPEPRFGYLAPYFVQAKDIAWNYLKHYSLPIMQIQGGISRAKKNESELSITLPHNGAQIRLYGAENVDRMRGLYFDGIVSDESQDIAPTALTSVILPCLADREGWLDLSGTPKGYGNLLGQTYKRALHDPEWFVQVLKASETNIIKPEELARLKRNMPSNEYEQEFECSFDAAITGAYYSKELEDAQFDGRITNVPYDKSYRVHTFWDLGMHDYTVIWFVQVVGREIHVIDYYEMSGQGLAHYARVLDEKKYLYGKHWAPHDIMVRELGTGKSRFETAAELGIPFEVAPNIPVKDGIDAVRMMLGRCWFDRLKTEPGVDALRQHREKFDNKLQISLGPLHDWTSHAADGFRIGVVGLEEKSIKAREDDINDILGISNGDGSWMG